MQYFAPRLYGSRALLWYTPEVNRGWLGEKLLWFNVRANSLGGAAKQAAWAGLFAAVTLLDSVARLLPGGEAQRGLQRSRSALCPCCEWCWVRAQGFFPSTGKAVHWRASHAGTRLLDVAAVPSAPASYDAQLAAALWDASADAVGVPREVQVPAAS